MPPALLPPAPTLHLPYDSAPFRMAMALTAAPETAWLEIDDTHADQVALRARLLAEQGDAVLANGDATAAGCRELLDMLAEHLGRCYPDWFVLDGVWLEDRLTGLRHDLSANDPLATVGRLVQEDFCLLRDAPDGPVFDSAILCFPSRWRLADKIGRALIPIHKPVPFYGDTLGRPVDRFFTVLKPGRLATRLNWSVLDDPTLFQPTGHSRSDHNAAITAANAGQTLFLRVERQTFRRLPQTGVLVFGIRVHVTPLAQVTALPNEAARLAAAIRILPPEMGRYKSVVPFRDALLAYLDNHADGAPGWPSS